MTDPKVTPPVTTPTTKAGKRLLGLFASTTGPAEPSIERVQALIAAIEAEAREDPCPHCVMQHEWPCPTISRCDEPGCERETSCGFPTPNGYRRTCGKHYLALLEADHD